MKKMRGGVTAPEGFKAAGIGCGLKRSRKPDLALITSTVPAVCAATFTTNQVKAAPVIVSQKQLKSSTTQAIIANAGNANCWTGKKGERDAWAMIDETAKQVGVAPSQVLVCSTGVIGKPLQINKVKLGIKKAAKELSRTGSKNAAQAILTTDTRPKEIAVKVGGVTIGGIAKGSGMIAPGMATMLAFITTDAKISRWRLQRMLGEIVAETFNMVSVDNCMSTNDCVIALANGQSRSWVSEKELRDGLRYVCEYLAKEIARDGEGAKKLLTARALEARNDKEARETVKALIGSFLLKAAVYGKDKNTGRILQAVGATKVRVDWDKFKFDWKMTKKEDVITVKLGVGGASAVGWGCDLTEGYVKINARYHT